VSQLTGIAEDVATLGRYQLLNQLGTGGMGAVYVARDSRLGRDVAIKVIRPQLLSTRTIRERFLREAQALASLDHPNIVSIFDAQVDGPVPFLVMPLLRGEPLSSRLEREEQLPPAEVVRIAREVLAGLAVIHDKGFVHRDVKPANIWLEEPTGRVRLIDLGIAGLGDSGDATRDLTAPGVQIGTPAYMSPEQFESRPIDARTDLFGLGIVLFQALTGHRTNPNHDPHLPAEYLREPDRSHLLRAETPPPLADLVMRLVQRDPSRRPSSAREVLKQLDAIAASPPSAAWQMSHTGTASLAPASAAPAIRTRGSAPATDLTPTFELRFEGVGGRPWRGRVVAYFRGRETPPRPVEEGWTPARRHELRWYVEEYLDLPEGGNAVRAAAIVRQLHSYGRELWRQLQSPAADAWLKAALQAEGGRLVLHAARPEDEVVFRTPWELLRVGEGEGSPLHQLDISLVRTVPSRLIPAAAPNTSSGLRILAVVSRPEGVGFLDLRATPAALLDAARDRPEVRVDFCRPATLPALLETLDHAREEKEPYHILHFDGHGVTADGGVGALCFEDAGGGLDLVKAARFGEKLAGARVPLVILSACRTAAPVSGEGTVAAELLRQGVGSVLATGYAVHVDLDRLFMGAFYDALARGLSIGAAVASARKRAAAEPRRRAGEGPDAPVIELQDWFVPQLYQGEADPVLLPRPPAPRRKTPFIPSVEEPPGLPPPPQAGFQGRGRELHQLERTILQHPVVVLHGSPGVGKTALAAEGARWWSRTRLFDAVAFVSFREAPTPDDVLAQVGKALTGSPQPRRRITELLREKPTLLVWDGFGDGAPATEFAPLAREWGHAGGRLLVTCRGADTGLPQAAPFALSGLTPMEGAMLLEGCLRRLGMGPEERQRAGLTADRLREVAERLGGHPLGLELIARPLCERGPDAVLAEMETQLARSRQEHPEAQNCSLAASLEGSIRSLSSAAREALPAVAQMAGDAPEQLVERVAGLDPDAWAAVRDELVAKGLARRDGPFLVTPSVLAAWPGAMETSPALRKRFVRQVVGLCGAFRQQARSTDPSSALAVLGRSEGVIRRALASALAAGELDAAETLTGALALYLELRGHAEEASRLRASLAGQAQAGGELTATQARREREAAVAAEPDAAVATLDQLRQRLTAITTWDTRQERALTLAALGRIYFDRVDRVGEALPLLDEAENLLRRLEEEGRSDSVNRAAVLGDRANALLHLARYPEAVEAATAALDLDRRCGNRLGEARDLARLADVFRRMGRSEEAETHYREALVLAREGADDELLGLLQQHLGILAAERSHTDDSAGHLREALAAFQRAKDVRGEMQIYNSLGGVEHLRNNWEAARAWYERGLDLAHQLGDVVGEAAVRSNLGQLLASQADNALDPGLARRLRERAVAEERAALALKERAGDPAAVALSHLHLAARFLHLDTIDEAERHAKEALGGMEALQHPETWRALRLLAKIATARDDPTEAETWRGRERTARREAEERAGIPAVPRDLLTAVLRAAVVARERRATLDEVLRAAGAPEGLLADLLERGPWLKPHLLALVDGAPRPQEPVPAVYRDLLDDAWRDAPSGR
jgi:tetratricopeptide (TPR) repeat protein